MHVCKHGIVWGQTSRRGAKENDGGWIISNYSMSMYEDEDGIMKHTRNLKMENEGEKERAI
jgi:hypothetical protein